MSANVCSLLVQDARLPGWGRSDLGASTRIAPGRRVDVRIIEGVVADVAERLEPEADEHVLRASGAVVLPGLHDHHLHLRALVAAGRSVAVGPDEIGSASGLADALHRAPVDGSGWRRAVGYHESVAGHLDRLVLDSLCPSGPVRVQHRSGVVWIVNSSGADALGLHDTDIPGVERDAAGRPTGRLFRLDAWLAGRLGDEDPVTAVATVSHRLAAKGVTGVTDATPAASDVGVAALVRAVADGDLLQRLHVMCAPEVPLDAHPLVSRGPSKVVLDDDRLPSLEELAERLRIPHATGAPVAVHCVTGAQLALALAALDSAGPIRGDRIEHGSVIHPGFFDALVRLAVTVVTNPGLVHARGDRYLEDVDEPDIPDLYRCASLLAAGVGVAAGTDAPFGPADPWTAVRAAVSRRTREGRCLTAAEGVSLEGAVGLFTGPATAPGRRRHVAVGEPGDLCLLGDGSVPQDAQDEVLATVVAGCVVHRSG